MYPLRRGLPLLAIGWALVRPFAAAAQEAPPAAVLVIEGRVIEESSGLPIQGVHVGVTARMRSTATDSTGAYRLEMRLYGHYLRVDAALPGYLPETREQQLPCDEIVSALGETPTCTAQFDFELRPYEPKPSESPRCTVSGRVLSGWDRSPAEGALVQVEGTEMVTSADRDGAYVLHDVPAGLHRVIGRTLGSLALSRLVVVGCTKPEQGPTLLLRLSPTWIS